METLLVTGGSGLLGSSIVRAASSAFKVYATYNMHPPAMLHCQTVKLDLTDRAQTCQVIDSIKPDIIVHCAALRSIDYCQAHPEQAFKVNASGTENLLLACQDRPVRFIHISTESVFDGSKGMYTEEDLPAPVTVYGRTKLEAEEKVRQLAPDYVIVRTSSIYGWSLFGKSLAEWVLAELRAGRPLAMFSDSFFSPTLSDNLAQALLELADNTYKGILNVAGKERCSRFDFARKVAGVFGLDEGLVLPSLLSESNLKAPRAKDSSLDVSKAMQLLRTDLLDVNDGLILFNIEKF